MTNWNDLTQSSRFKTWKQFRQDLEHFETDEEHIRAVARFFADFPNGTRSLDFYTPNTWPTPWEILANGNFCVNEVSILMYYTLTMTSSFTGDVDLVLIDDDDRFLVPVVNNEFILNYHIGDFTTTAIIDPRIVSTYTSADIKAIF